MKEKIIKYLNNELKPDEAKELVEWVKADKENEKMFVSYKEIWNYSTLSAVKPEKTEKEWQRFEKKINWDTKQFIRPAGFKVQVIKSYLLRAAAVMVLLVGIGMLIQHFVFSGSQTQAVYNSEMVVLHGEKNSIELSDGTMVWVNSGSSLLFSDFSDSKERRVYLSGEAYFEVAKSDQQPFIVETPDMLIRVVGTSFNVSSYPDDNFVSATLVSGQVEIKDILSGCEIFTVMHPNQKADINRETRNMEFSYVDVNLYTSWVDNKMIFNNLCFSEIVSKLERWYNMDVVFDKQSFENTRITAKFLNNEPIFDVLQVMSIPGAFEYEIENSTIYITKK